MKYDNFFVPIDDMEKAMDYYGNVLGLKLKFNFQDKGMVSYNVGDEEPAIILKDKKIFKDMKLTIWFVVDDVKEEYKKMKKNGIEFISEPFEIGTGTSAEFEDPFGNRFGITDYKK
ncbi:VOC family protein [Methanobrevibacter sp. TMH8]|uniref:VOC family protein n=1 Tax=Methanobrevibacter sp. TMH8 TaxID=2848611 RepID=UPI001CCF9559|nr:VOC family protein [Methanobrevibacter sp. TMH8]MBZ9570604.1 VOC family protein [Methanobrevibacter sp. TMH8]